MINDKTVNEGRSDDLLTLKVYSLREIQGIVGVTYRTLQNCIADGRLHATKIAGKWRVTEADLRKFLNGEQ